ncbi:MAG: accessory gene regulator B family protein [Anaerorhabdus sp.]|uniref:accessory gene regulator B family protein n=1 Tax=Anaerorhabdus sp. TaxID=1872524 RepID=UPI002FCC9D72
MKKLKGIENRVYNLLLLYGANIEKDVFSYGFITFLNYFVYLISIIPIAIAFNLIDKVIFFLIVFIPLRRYIGGFHFNSKLLCLIFSIIFTLSIPLLAIPLGKINIIIRACSLILGMIITCWIKAVDHPNKRISKKEKQLFTKRAILIELLYSMIILCFYNTSVYIYLNITYLTLLFCILGITIARVLEIRYN